MSGASESVNLKSGARIRKDMYKIFISILLIVLPVFSGFAQENLNSAQLNLIAADKSNNPIGDLGKDEITLLIDGKPQPVTSLEKQKAPLIYALALDSSGSMKSVFRDIQHVAVSIIAQNRANDETTLVSFIGSSQIYAPLGFSSDKNLLTRAINEFAVEGGQSAVIDAVYLSVKKVGEYKREDKTRPRAVIIITDGEDRDSYYTEKALFKLIENEIVPVFFIGLVNGLDDSTQFAPRSRKERAENFIKKVSEKSGGAAIFPKKLADAADRITSLLQMQYVVGYSPSAEVKGKSSKIEIKLAKDSKRKDVKFYVNSNNTEK